MPATIAESGGQSTPAQSARFIDIAIGSLSETQNHLELAGATGLISANDATTFIAETRELRKMTFAFRKWLLRR